MKTKLICDTNVFYNIANGVNKQSFCSKNEQLYFSPVTVAELLARLEIINQSEYNERKNVAKTIIDLDAKELVDPESFIADIFGCPQKNQIKWKQLLVHFSKSISLKELTGKIDTKLARNWWEDVKKDRVDKYIKEMKSQIKGFDRWYADRGLKPGEKPHLKGEDKKKLLCEKNQLQWRAAVCLTLKSRAMHGNANIKRQVKAVTEGKYASALDKFECYCNIYMQYYSELLTTKLMPQDNDLADLELFLYSTDDNSIIVTYEKRWRSLAKKAGFEKRVRHLKESR